MDKRVTYPCWPRRPLPARPYATAEVSPPAAAAPSAAAALRRSPGRAAATCAPPAAACAPPPPQAHRRRSALAPRLRAWHGHRSAARSRSWTRRETRKRTSSSYSSDWDWEFQNLGFWDAISRKELKRREKERTNYSITNINN